MTTVATNDPEGCKQSLEGTVNGRRTIHLITQEFMCQSTQKWLDNKSHSTQFMETDGHTLLVPTKDSMFQAKNSDRKGAIQWKIIFENLEGIFFLKEKPS